MRHPSRLLLATSLLALTAGAAFAAVAVKPQLKPKWDLGSTFRTMPAKALNLTKAIEIQEGKSVRKVDNKSVLTPSEFIAVLELKSGKQTLTLSDKGVAVGGQFALDDGTTYFNLHVPKSVTANYAPSKTGLKVNGVLLNEGTIVIASSSSSPTATLTEDVLVNRGIIQSASAITVLSTATIENLGSISATLKTGEIDFNNSSTRPLTVAAIAGTISGDSLKFTSKGDISVNDGTYAATKVAFTGGKISVAAKEIDGSVDVTGSSPQVKVRKGKLNLGKQTITKSPVTAKSAVSPRSPNDNSGFYMNTAGDISIPDVNSDGNDVYAFASGNITAGTISTVDTQSPNTTTARVFLSAGVSFTGSPLNEHLGCTDCSETAGVELDSAGSTTSTSQSGSITVSGAITAQEVQLAALNVTVSGAITVDNITNPQGGSVYISSDGAVSLQAVNIANEYFGTALAGELMIGGATVNADDFYAGPTSVTIAGDISGSAIINASGPVNLQNISDTGVGVTEITTGFNPADYAGEGGGGSPSVVKPAVLSPRDASATIRIGNYTGSELVLAAAGNIGTGTINLPDQSSFPYPGSSCTGPHEVLIVSNVGGGSSASAFQVGGGGGNGTGIITVAGTTNVCYEPYGAIILSNSGDMNIAAGSINSTSGEGGTPDIILSAPNGTLTLNQDLSASGDASNEAGSIMIDTNALVLGGSVATITANDPSMNAYPSITIAAASISAPNGLNLSTNGDYYTSISLVPAGSLDFSDLPYYTSGGAPSSPFQLPDFNPTSSPLTISGGALNATADSTGGQIYLSGYPLTLDGGAVNLTSQGDYSRITVDYNGSEGQNTLSFAGGPITMNADNPNGTAYGGSISINGDTVDTSAQSVTLSANGSDSGSGGGNITVNLTHSDLEVGAATTPWTFAAKGGTTSGDGGSISISVPDGAFTLVQGSAANASVQAANGSGGYLSYTGGTLTFNSDGGNSMNVDGQGTGNGGLISLSAQAAGSQLVLDSSQTNGVSVSAKGGTSGNGGYAFLSAVTNVSITSSDVNVAAGSDSGSNGNGGYIVASTSDAAGTIAVSGNLNADGQGMGVGGNILLSSAGSLTVTGTSYSANAGPSGNGNGGTISFSAQGASATPMNLGTANITADGGSSGTGGNISITSTSGDISGTGSISADGGCSDGDGGQVTLSGNNVSFGSIGASAGGDPNTDGGSCMTVAAKPALNKAPNKK